MPGIDPSYYNAPCPVRSVVTREQPLTVIDQFIPGSFFASGLYTFSGVYALKMESPMLAIPLFCAGFLSFYKSLYTLHQRGSPAQGKGA